jgi:hypothetical protein
MHGLIFETSIWLLAESSRLLLPLPTLQLKTVSSGSHGKLFQDHHDTVLLQHTQSVFSITIWLLLKCDKNQANSPQSLISLFLFNIAVRVNEIITYNVRCQTNNAHRAQGRHNSLQKKLLHLISTASQQDIFPLDMQNFCTPNPSFEPFFLIKYSSVLYKTSQN